MGLNGIDISSYQQGIDLSKVPGDFVIVKATQGTNYTNPAFTAQMKSAEKAGKLLGVYHYISGGGAEAEMKHFYSNIKPYIGKAIICLDWESIQNNAWRDESYLKRCIDAIKKLTKKTIVIYASLSVFPNAICSQTGCKKWIAQYANYDPTGYQIKPWNEGAYSCLIRQYAESGQLKGWGGKLDLNKAYCTKDEWNKLAGKTSSTSTSKPSTAKKSTEAIAKEVIAGKWGNGETRKKKLTAAGYDYNAVQKKVNELVKAPAKKSTDALAKEIYAGKWGNEPTRTKKLKAAGYTTAEIKAAQAKVNRM